jgi:DNA-binding MurR/RpiR family transcriptional regulator
LGTVQRIFEEHVHCLHETLRINSSSSLEAAAEAITRAKRTVLFCIGQSYPVAYSLGIRLAIIGLSVFLDADSHTQLVAAAGMKRGEVGIGISLSGSTGETVESLRLSQERGAKTICITNSLDSPLARAADIRLFAAPSEVKYFHAGLASRVTQMALADVLLYMVARLRGRKALAQLARAEEHLLRRRIVDRV